MAVYGPDVDVYLTIVEWPRWSHWDNLELLARITITTSGGVFLPNTEENAVNGYRFHMFPRATNSVMMLLKRLDNNGGGTGTLLASVDHRPVANGDKVGLRCLGSEISGWHYTGGAWTQVLTATDATHSGPGYVGWYLPGNNNDTNTTNPGIYDDFGGGTITGSAFPEAPVLDTFNRADAATLGSAWQGLYHFNDFGPLTGAISGNQATNGNFVYPAGAAWAMLYLPDAPAVAQPRINNSVPCCDTTPTGGTSAGPILQPDPTLPLPAWIASCTGGGLAPDGTDVVNSESWLIL